MNYNTAELCKDCKMPVSKNMLGNNLIREVAHLTDINYHTEARLLIANAIKDRYLINGYSRVKRAQDKAGHLTIGLMRQRQSLDRILTAKLREYDDGNKALGAL